MLDYELIEFNLVMFFKVKDQKIYYIGLVHYKISKKCYD
jgi:hypothetical protein